MTVAELLTKTGWNTNFIIQGTTEKKEIVQLAYGIVGDIRFPLIPYGKYEIKNISVDENCLYIIIDSKVNCAYINPIETDIMHNNFAGYTTDLVGEISPCQQENVRRLIDADELAKELETAFDEGLIDCFIDILEIVGKASTAYDVDKVVEQLAKASGRDDISYVDWIMLDDAIEIVKAGGKE